MNELALFAGIGGGILGGRILGWETVCAVEQEPYAISVLLQRQNDGLLPIFPVWDDVRSFDGYPWRGCADVVSGGFPCQDISIAGKGAGIDGGRSGLWGEMHRVIGEVRPAFVFAENSPTLTRRGLVRVVKDLARLGYDAAWGVLGADAVGLLHHRTRLWLVAYDASQRSHAWRLLAACGVRKPPRQPRGLPRLEMDCGGGRAHLGDDSVRIFRVPADGVPAEVGELRAYGNAQVPAVAATAFRVLAWRLLGDRT